MSLRAQSGFDHISGRSRRGGLLCALLVAGLALPAMAQQYQAIILNPTGATEAFAYGAGNGQQVGTARSPATGDNTHAALWTGTAGSYIDLNPTIEINGFPFSGTFAYGAGGGQQVGNAILGPRTVAVLWTGTANSVVVLARPDMAYSTVSDTDGTTQVGQAQANDPVLGLSNYAFAWTGTPESATFMHPDSPIGFYESTAFKVRGTRAIGTATDLNEQYAAILWTSFSPSGAIVLRSAEFAETVGSDVLGTTAVGYGHADGGYNHALIWTNDGANVTDIHPPAYQGSFLYAMDATRQVGIGVTMPDGDGNTFEHAMVWSGTAASAIDLHTALLAVVPGVTDSTARGIDADGSIVGTANTSGSGYLAVRWVPVNASSGVCCIGTTCSVVASSSACETQAGTAGLAFAFTSGGACGSSQTSPCCVADYNKAEGVGVADIFAFLSAWFGQSTYASFAGTTPQVADIFQFLSAWFAGC